VVIGGVGRGKLFIGGGKGVQGDRIARVLFGSTHKKERGKDDLGGVVSPVGCYRVALCGRAGTWTKLKGVWADVEYLRSLCMVKATL